MVFLFIRLSSIARLRAAVTSHAPGLRGRPSRCHARSARTNASCAQSSASDQSPVSRTIVPKTTAHSSRCARSRAARTATGSVGSAIYRSSACRSSGHTGRSSIVEHLLSTALFVIYLVEFLLVGAAASSVFFLLMIMSLVDVTAGFTISITGAGRDVTME